MATKVIMPKQGLQMTEGTIISWLAKEGEKVVKDEPLFEMETDKLTITMESPESGTLLKIIKDEGETVPITETIAIVGEPGEDISALLGGEMPESKEEVSDASQRIFISPRAKTLVQEKGVDIAALKGSGPEGLIIEKDVFDHIDKASLTTPLAKKIAQMDGVDLSNVTGTGARGKITKEDVIAAGEDKKLVPLTGMRKVIARKMKESLLTSAQAAVQVQVDYERMRAHKRRFQKQRQESII